MESQRLDPVAAETAPALAAPGVDGPPFPVVGIGASAGGLEAYLQLFRSLPARTGMAYVLVQHLDPTHESHLVELIAKVSPLPILEAQDHQPVQPDHVYVIPPHTCLSMEQGLLRLQPRPDGRGPFMPVDDFFASLAEDRRGRAIAVVLSGTGSDGTLGVKAVKAEGGITFAQDDTAQHAGMPRSAVSSECVDFVLPPEGIARELVRLGLHPYLIGGIRVNGAVEQGKEDESLAALFRLLRTATRIDYAHYKRSTILRRIQRRLIVHRLERLADYVGFIGQHPEELQALHQDLLIHVTRFFRDPPAFDALAATVFPTLVKDRPPDEPIRIWVPGCATGEEVYSLAIRLLEFLGDSASARPIKFFATDVSELALEKARSGKYLENITVDVSPERLHRFFVREESGYQISKAIRDLCVFARHDMTRDPPFSNLDLISCRNVLIYLGAVLQKRVMPIFHYALKDRGYLLLGGSESIGAVTDLFSLVDTKQKIYLRKATPRRLTFDFTTGEPSFGHLPSAPGPGRDVVSGLDIQRETDRLVLGHYAPPAVVVNEDLEIVQSRGATGAFLALAPGVASLNLLKMARDGLLLDLRAALEESKRTGQPCRRTGLRVRTNGHYQQVTVQVFPVTIGKQRFFTIVFEDAAEAAPEPTERPAASAADGNQLGASDRQVQQLQQELIGTKDYLQSIIEQLEGSNEELQAANEEILSSNEELQSTNEELQTAKEELQATNEELNTVNEELQHRNREATQLSDDLANLFRSVNIPIVMVGQDLRIRRFTPSAAELFNFIPGDTGRPIADIKPKLVGVDLQSRIVNVLETLVAHEEEVRDEQGRWQSLCIRPYRTQESRIDGAVISIVDIDALKRSEQASKQARDYAESIIGTIDVPLLVLDAELRVASANSAFYEAFGGTPVETVKQPLAVFGAQPWNAPRVLELVRAALHDDQAFRDFEVQQELAAGNRQVLLLSGQRILHLEQKLLLLKIEDVSERRRLETQLRQAQKMEAVGHLAAGVAHDFNNLLTVINGYCAVLAERPGKDAEARDMIATVSQAGEKAAILTRQLLAFSRKTIIAPRMIDVRKLVAESEQMLNRLIGEDICLRASTEAGLGQVLADPTLLSQAILNLAINARDAMPHGGDLTIEARNVDVDENFIQDHPDMLPGPYVLLSVRDTGCGMDEHALARAFEPFFTTKGVGQGTGLGLASVYGSIKQSGGFIFVSSQPDHGTEFSIYLPRLPGPLVAAEPPVTPVPVAKGSEVLLLVEDSKEVRTLAALVLRSAGYTVLEAGDGLEALAVAQEHPVIHLLVTDVVMPKMGGRQLADRLHVLRPDLKVLLLSGYTENTTVRGGVEKAAVPFLQKPYSPTALKQKVRDVLDQDRPK